MRIKLLSILFLFVIQQRNNESFAQGIKILPGITFEASYIGEFASNINGGSDQGSVYLQQTGIIGNLDTREIGLWPGGTLYAFGFDLRGGSPTRLAGDYQVVSNIDAPDGLLLYEAWYEQILLDERLSLLGGLYGLDSEFDIIQSAALFIHSSHGTGAELAASGLNGPSIFPYSSLALRAKVAISENVFIQSAVLEAVSGIPGNNSGINVRWNRDEGLLLISELIWISGQAERMQNIPGNRSYRGVRRTATNNYKTKIALGGWSYTRSYNNFSTDTQNSGNNSMGFYLLGETQLVSEKVHPLEGLDVFARAGMATSGANRLTAYLGAGLVYTGPVPDRSKDKLGVGIASAVNGDPYRNSISFNGSSPDRTETNIEVMYYLPLHEKIALQTDYQYIINPNTNPEIENASVILFRFILSL